MCEHRPPGVPVIAAENRPAEGAVKRKTTQRANSTQRKQGARKKRQA